MKKTALALSMAAMVAGPAMAADPAAINWSKVAAANVPLFYPGQSSYEWLRTSAHPGQKMVQDGLACITCHKGTEKKLGEKLVKGGPLEPTPVKGKTGYKDLKVQAAYDASNLYLRFQWQTQGKRPGNNYPYYRFDGQGWARYGGPRLAKAVQEGKQPAVYEDRMSFMLDDGKVPMFATQGCWLTCHEGERDMPKVASNEDVAGNAMMQAIKKADVRKYLPASRSNAADWKSGKSLDELKKLKAEGHFVDLIQWRAHRTNIVGGTDDGYVLEWRYFDSGANHFASNMDGAKKMPKFMFDAAKFGSAAIAEKQIGQKEAILVKGVNAVPFDPAAGWKEGDLLPQYVVSGADAKGSAADNKGQGSWAKGSWTVVVTRPLNLANDDDKVLKEGGVYNVGFAVHDDNITTRGHQISFVRTLGIGAKTKADIRAVKLR